MFFTVCKNLSWTHEGAISMHMRSKKLLMARIVNRNIKITYTI